jgi:hypothetical protein
MRQLIAMVVLVGLSLTASEAGANSMGGLAFVVLIWPIGILCALVLIILGIVAAMKMRRGRASSALATALLIVSITVGVIYPLLTVALGSDAPTAVRVISILPVEVLAVAGAVMSFMIRRRARERHQAS